MYDSIRCTPHRFGCSRIRRLDIQKVQIFLVDNSDDVSSIHFYLTGWLNLTKRECAYLPSIYFPMLLLHPLTQCRPRLRQGPHNLYLLYHRSFLHKHCHSNWNNEWIGSNEVFTCHAVDKTHQWDGRRLPCSMSCDARWRNCSQKAPAPFCCHWALSESPFDRSDLLSMSDNSAWTLIWDNNSIRPPLAHAQIKTAIET